MQRIGATAAGLPSMPTWGAWFHTDLQATLTATFAVGFGVLMYLIDRSAPSGAEAAQLARPCSRPGTTATEDA
jgi:hypothetical protein